MATLARYEAIAQDTAGNILPSPTIEVRLESTNALASIWSDRAGASPLSNPFTGTVDGEIAFHALGNAYKITITQGAVSRVLRYVPIGVMAEFDNTLTNGLPALYMQLGGVINFGPSGNATMYADAGELFVDGSSNGWNFRVGAKTGAAGIFKQITVCGSDNGTGAGTFIQSDLGATGSMAWALGNRSALLGGAFDRQTVLLGRDGIDFGIGEPGVSFNTYMRMSTAALAPYANGGIALGTTSLRWSGLKLAANAVIDFGGQVTATHDNTNGKLSFAGAFGLYAFDNTVKFLSANSITAGGITGAGLQFSTATNFGIFFGSGAPTLSAAKGSLYLRSDGTTTNNRAYINTDGGTTWTACTTVA